jgi:hypothetical protein
MVFSGIEFHCRRGCVQQEQQLLAQCLKPEAR